MGMDEVTLFYIDDIFTIFLWLLLVFICCLRSISLLLLFSLTNIAVKTKMEKGAARVTGVPDPRVGDSGGDQT
jgi:hypothetical protein